MAPTPEGEDLDVALRRLLARALEGPGALDPRLRREAAGGAAQGEPLAAYVGKLEGRPGDLGPGDVEALRRAGLSEDEVFELTAIAALAAAKRRLDAGLRALQESEDPGPERG